jgi:ketose-bisphosphate aldolase
VTVATLTEILAQARLGHYAVGYFEAWDQHSLEAVMEAAEEMASPAILGFGAAVTNLAWLDAAGIEALAALARLLAERSKVPTAILFNEAQSYAHALRGLKAGCNCVMLDTARLPFDEHVAATQALVAAAHAVGAAVEAELGYLPDASGQRERAGAATDPEQAARFVQATGVDALAVSVGNVHLLMEGRVDLDFDLLERLQRAVPVPLVLHGGTGIRNTAIPPAIQRGVAKVNYGTRLKLAFLEGVQAGLRTLPQTATIHDLVGSRYPADFTVCGKVHMKALMRGLITLYGSAGKSPAAAASAAAAPAKPLAPTPQA